MQTREAIVQRNIKTRLAVARSSPKRNARNIAKTGDTNADLATAPSQDYFSPLQATPTLSMKRSKGSLVDLHHVNNK